MTVTEAELVGPAVPRDFTWRYPMINNAQLTAVLPVVDVTRAAGFYRDRLGLKDLGV